MPARHLSAKKTGWARLEPEGQVPGSEGGFSGQGAGGAGWGAWGRRGFMGPSPEVCPWLVRVMSRKYPVFRPGRQWPTCLLIQILEGWQGVLGEGGGRPDEKSP